MSIAIEQMIKRRNVFSQKSDLAEVNKLMIKITQVVNNLAMGVLPDSPQGTQGGGFNILTGSELSEYQMKLSGYKYYLADLIADLMAKSRYLEAYIKDYRATNWARISDEITQRDGKVKNKEMIDNVLLQELSNDIEEQIFYEAEYQRVKLKSLALDDILTVIVQRIAELKKQVETSKQY